MTFAMLLVRVIGEWLDGYFSLVDDDTDDFDTDNG
eukprot:CAMPEP_0178760620 /NCGR_PEP_ID=MMETSP0744-20121128/15586_1 /TAXON_ID=913974 /ORGANISM="Nitzschia punctata, Strain CCMP561" /LENGTH=34 /DNA_ID= /DNA_START= /DNA_END= /DNA_ORIENTATION=